MDTKLSEEAIHRTGAVLHTTEEKTVGGIQTRVLGLAEDVVRVHPIPSGNLARSGHIRADTGINACNLARVVIHARPSPNPVVITPPSPTGSAKKEVDK